MVEKEVRLEHYKEALFEKKQFWHRINILHSEGHEIYSMRMNKVSLLPFDTKRWIADDGVHTLAYRAQRNHYLAGGSCVFGGTTNTSSREKPRLGPSDK